MRVSEIAQIVGGVVVGDPDREIYNVQKIEEAGEGTQGFGGPVAAPFGGVTRAGGGQHGRDLKVSSRTGQVLGGPARARRPMAL